MNEQQYMLLAQLIGIVAMAMNILSFLQKKKRSILIMQLFGATLFTVNFFMLGAITGAMLNFIAIIRATVYANKERFHAEKKIWVFAFSTAFFIAYLLNFFALGKEPNARNLIVEFVPTIAMVVSTISFSMSGAAQVRKLALIVSPLWLIYNIINVAIGGALCEIFSICSVVIGMLRHDTNLLQKRNKTAAEDCKK